LIHTAHGTLEFRARNSFILSAVLFITLPPIFFVSRDSKLDRFIGEFSYPVYLWQVLVLSYVGYDRWALLYSILLSIPIVLWVEVPLERWRSNTLRAYKQARAVALQPANGREKWRTSDRSTSLGLKPGSADDEQAAPAA
jgi:peptidoglycan/LPS O-acetylase OafA/YrhL